VQRDPEGKEGTFAVPHAPAGLAARLTPVGHILAMITRKTPETKVLIDWGWHAEP